MFPEVQNDPGTFPEFQAQCPQPAACSSSQPCVVSCGDSRVIIFPPPVVVTFPAPILTSCPQETVLGSSGIQPGASLGAEIPFSGGFDPKSRPILTSCSQEISGIPPGASLGAEIPFSGGFDPKSRPILTSCQPEISLGSLGIPPGVSMGSLRAEIPFSGRFAPKSTSRPIFGADPLETGLGSSGISPGFFLGSLGEEIPFPGRFAPKSSDSGGFAPKSRPRRCSYVFSSRWIHPCQRSSSRSQGEAGKGEEEKIPEAEKLETVNRDEEKEENEVLEV